uniref:Uncharacterized protein n=1 Tax=Arundo donax TaxID=35708 RepID=A0A0A8YKY7_ARUDO
MFYLQRLVIPFSGLVKS